jgi:hypothetical protein
MTRRITISLPDDVAEYAERSGSNTSGFIAGVLRRRMRAEDLRAQWARRGYVVTDEDLERTRARLADLPPISDAKHAENLKWIEQFDAGSTTAS